MNKELERKAIHVLVTLLVPIHAFLGPTFYLLVYASAVAALRLEAVRFYLGRLLVFDDLMREDERERLAGYFYLLLGLAMLVTLTKSFELIASGILVAGLSDAASAIVGISRGKHRYKLVKTRSLEGSLAGFLVTLAVTRPFMGAAGSLAASILYTLNDAIRPGDDNLSNPLVPLVAWEILCLPRIL